MAAQNDNYFKKYKRGQRVQTSEESISLGMQFTNAPLKSGASRLLVNFDLKDKGEVLIPRPALQAFKYTSQLTNPVTSKKDITNIIAGRHCAEFYTEDETAVELEQMLCTDGTNLIAYTLKPDSSKETRYLYDYSTDGAIPCVLVRPESASVHNIPVNNRNYAVYNVGTFGFNNSYYCFNPNTKQLAYTKLDQEMGIYKFEAIEPKAIDPKEAVSWGYNMLQENAYTFTDSAFVGTVQLLGILPYDANNNLALNAKVNETVTLRCYYKGPDKTYTITWEWKELVSSTWTTFATQKSVSLKELPALKQQFSFPAEQVFVRVTFTLEADNTIEQVLTVSFDLKQSTSSTLNLKPENYDLSTATGMSYWKNRLIVYGLPKDPTILFMSEVNDPTYFPYPNCGDIFDEPIVQVLPFLDNLLVFTVTKLYMLTLSEDAMSWTKKQIQANLDISPWDRHLTQQVKNMVFFKSGNYYYMVVPSLKTGDLVITNVSKNIEGLFDSFKENIDSLVDLMYSYNRGLELIHYYNYLDYEDVHNVYVFETDNEVLVNVDVLYNTMTRTWRIYIYESKNILVPYKQNATNRGTLVGLYNKGLQFIKYNTVSAKDTYFNFDYMTQETFVFKNYQLLDTGYRDINSDYIKRYREYQMKFNNISHRTLAFSTDFYIDGELRQDMYNYKVVHFTDIDPEDPKYNTIVVEKDLIPRMDIPGATALGEDETSESMWQLDVAGFPDIYFWKVRVPVSGKGYAPRMRFISYNEELFEILNMTWVYRLLYSR